MSNNKARSVVEVQDDFSDGMVDTPVDGKPISDKSFLYSEDMEFLGNFLINRKRASCYHSYSFVLRGSYRFSIAGLDAIVIAFRTGTVDYVRLGVYSLSSTGESIASFRVLSFPSLFGYSDGALYGDTDNPVSAPIVFLQVGNAAYVWVKRGADVLAFRWDGNVSSALVQLPTGYGAGEGNIECMPSARAACFAYGRVFCATTNSSGTVFDSLSVSKVVSDFSNPKLQFLAYTVDLGSASSDDILGMCPVGNGRLVVFKRNSVWMVTGCDGEPSGIKSEVWDAVHGCVGPTAFVQVLGDVWFISDDGVRSVSGSGNYPKFSSQLPETAPISRFWSQRVDWPLSVSYLASAAVYDGRLLFSVPLDGAVLNSLLVYDISRSCWVGVWTDMPACGMHSVNVVSGAGLKLLDSTGSLYRFLSGVEYDLGNVRFVSRRLSGAVFSGVKSFVRAQVGLVCDGAYSDGTPRATVADFRTLDETDLQATHIDDRSCYGCENVPLSIGRNSRSLSVDIFFKYGRVVVRSIAVQSIVRGRL